VTDSRDWDQHLSATYTGKQSWWHHRGHHGVSFCWHRDSCPAAALQWNSLLLLTSATHCNTSQQWQQSLYVIWPLTYHFSKWYASSFWVAINITDVFSLYSLHYFTQQFSSFSSFLYRLTYQFQKCFSFCGLHPSDPLPGLHPCTRLSPSLPNLAYHFQKRSAAPDFTYHNLTTEISLSTDGWTWSRNTQQCTLLR